MTVTRMMFRSIALVAATMLTLATAAYAADATSDLRPFAASPSPIATQSPMLAAGWAGTRAVSVGANGIVLLSDDQGKTYRQAKSVPVSSTLTGVSFIDAKHGWAVGHWGAILATIDGGETWQIQRMAAQEDRPLFAVHFFDAKRGVAVGLWSLVLVTEDGGKTWLEQPVNGKNGTKSDLNLINLFAASPAEVYATAEKGQVLHSRDYGHSWEFLDTGYTGSLWTGTSLPDGSLIVGGQRGTLMRSSDNGRSWTRVSLETTHSITSIVQAAHTVLVLGLEGLKALSNDSGRTFTKTSPEPSESFTAALGTQDQRWLLFSRQGVVHESK